MIVGLEGRLDSALIADLDFAIEELEKERGLDYALNEYGIENIREVLLDYIFKEDNFNTQKFYFDNNNTFIHYRTLDENFTNKFQKYSKEKIIPRLQLVANDK